MIPELKDTPDAIRFGKIATSAEAEELEAMRDAALKLVANARRQPLRRQEAFDLAFKAQFYGEALKAYRGEVV